MKTRFFFIPLFWALVLLPLQAPAADPVRQGPDEGVVAFCFDGDTVKLKDRRIVRLAGIDAPEKARKDTPAQFYSRESKRELEELVRGRHVRLEFPGEAERDRHGRLVANMILDDGKSVNGEMISRGAAFFYPHSDLDPEYQENLRKLQAEAIEGRRGLWDRLLSLPLAKKSYVGNKNSLRFFPVDDCWQGQRIKPRNREDFGTLMDAFLAGYAPARICVFWPEAKRE